MRLTPLVIAVSCAALAAPAAAHAQPHPSAPPAAPGVSVPGGRYDHTVKLDFRAERGTTVRYTLDGTAPTRTSRAYSPAGRCGSPRTPTSRPSPSTAGRPVCPWRTAI